MNRLHLRIQWTLLSCTWHTPQNPQGIVGSGRHAILNDHDDSMVFCFNKLKLMLENKNNILTVVGAILA